MDGVEAENGVTMARTLDRREGSTEPAEQSPDLVFFVLATLGFFVVFIGIGIWLVGAMLDGQGFSGDSGGLPIIIFGIGLGLAVFIGIWSVTMIPHQLLASVIGVVSALLAVFLFSSMLFAHAAATELDTDVLLSDGVRHSAWVAADTVPVVKLDDALGLQPLVPPVDIDGSPGSGFVVAPAGWWMPGIAVRAATAFILLAGARALWRYASR
jgi:hypothetical protein